MQMTMARQTGAFRIRGTLYGLTYYKLRGKYYVRQKSSLDRDQVMRDVRFSRSRDCMRRFGMASRIVKTVYQMLPKKERRHGLFGSLTGFANALLFTGESPEMVQEELLCHLLGLSALEKILREDSISRSRSTTLCIRSCPDLIGAGKDWQRRDSSASRGSGNERIRASTVP